MVYWYTSTHFQKITNPTSRSLHHEESTAARRLRGRGRTVFANSSRRWRQRRRGERRRGGTAPLDADAARRIQGLRRRGGRRVDAHLGSVPGLHPRLAHRGWPRRVGERHLRGRRRRVDGSAHGGGSVVGRQRGPRRHPAAPVPARLPLLEPFVNDIVHSTIFRVTGDPATHPPDLLDRLLALAAEFENEVLGTVILDRFQVRHAMSSGSLLDLELMQLARLEIVVRALHLVAANQSADHFPTSILVFTNLLVDSCAGLDLCCCRTVG